MATRSITHPPISELKRNLLYAMGDMVGSSHLTEAIASGLGFRTHAALKAAPFDEQRAFDQGAFIARLKELGYAEELASLSCGFPNQRTRAWRNLAVCALNEAILRGLLSIQAQGLPPMPYELRWEHLFEFELPNGIKATAVIRDGGFDEVIVRVAINPKGELFKTYGYGLQGADVVAGAWFARLEGAWLQVDNAPEFACRRALLDELASLEVVPLGYADHGPFIV